MRSGYVPRAGNNEANCDSRKGKKKKWCIKQPHGQEIRMPFHITTSQYGM